MRALFLTGNYHNTWKLPVVRTFDFVETLIPEQPRCTIARTIAGVLNTNERRSTATLVNISHTVPLLAYP
jgi:hypothetical protein